ncbi:pyruvate,water dikinase [Mobilisporobacter senegalensis]|uniref:Pyruvate,water dikinase n=1 Tax=Mobilisporobacter senegalensis TaxID=1329262 RepID=A0A3N1XYX5_9FIRM|nr:PEP/pyruvate-binding domain-containing protein [Mobilisporobacter senegalensis]ROR31441.1 pyruvate,water dikinase [Mobilisporobacter senegalensis]
MSNMVKKFQDITPELEIYAGGKGCMLSQMYQTGLPVPPGFVIFPSAFCEGNLDKDAWKDIKIYIDELKRGYKGAKFAVRSSALSEDSAAASFAGEFETVLNVQEEKEILEAIDTVIESGKSERVKVYSEYQGMEHAHQLAIVVQLMIPSQISGVLFTVDPITGSRRSMSGNYVHGLGEQLVSGEANALSFKLIRPKGKYEGPDEFKKYSKKLFQYGMKLERSSMIPQDIEWAVSDGRLYLLQARPITTLTPGNLDKYDINDSLTGDDLWVNTNVGEAIPDVITPYTWSIIRNLDEKMTFSKDYYVWSGNICGRIYSNYNRRISAYTLLGLPVKSALKISGTFFGNLPKEIEFPIYPYTKTDLFKEILPKVLKFSKNVRKASKTAFKDIENNPVQCLRIQNLIHKCSSKEELISLWETELKPYSDKILWLHGLGGSKGIVTMNVKKKLLKFVTEEDANTLLSNLRGTSELASLGPVTGISKIMKGEMSKEEYFSKYGHRGPHEFELSIPHPAEDPSWIDRQIEEFIKSETDVDGLLKRQHLQYEDALLSFKERYPKKTGWLKRQLAKVSEAARTRESARSEWTRVYRLNRTFALKVGEITEIGDDVFYLYIDEVLSLLAGDATSLPYIPIRKENHEKYKKLPSFPTVIRGRFDPFTWSKESNRRLDYYDASKPITVSSNTESLTGFAGAAGRVEGTVRILNVPEEGHTLLPGEILVATTTNVGWTPLFPKAAAIITDVGAPLSHAAIVARELGIPAVVGCGNATARLKTGDRVVVDGGQGTVHLLP